MDNVNVVVLTLHADEADCFLPCGLCNICLKIDQGHHCDNLSISHKIEHWDKSCERCKVIRGKKHALGVGFIQTGNFTSAATVDCATQSLMTCPGPVNTAFAQGVDLKKMIQMKNFAQGVVKIAVSVSVSAHPVYEMNILVDFVLNKNVRRREKNNNTRETSWARRPRS